MTSYKSKGAGSASIFGSSVVVTVEVQSADLSSDGGPPPNVRCTLEHRIDISARASSVVSTSVCQKSWNPVWKEVVSLLVISPVGAVVDLALWDEITGEEPSCLGEAVIPVVDLVPSSLYAVMHPRSVAIYQGEEEDRLVGTVLLRPVHSSELLNLNSRPKRIDAPSRAACVSPASAVLPREIAAKSWTRLSPGSPRATSAPHCSVAQAAASLRDSSLITVNLVRGTPTVSASGQSDPTGLGLQLEVLHDGTFGLAGFVWNSPAFIASRAGMLEVGDTIEWVDGTRLVHIPFPDVITALSGDPGSSVHLCVRRTADGKHDQAASSSLRGRSLLPAPHFGSLAYCPPTTAEPRSAHRDA
jgi:hypothetical protein